MENNNKNEINRRKFFRKLGIGTVASMAALYGCNGNKNKLIDVTKDITDVPTDKMTYRINRNTGDKVSLLGYGCMRWPLKQKASGDGEEIDQEAVNTLVDYAIEHGVNYFDTSPRYVRGLSEKATGIALSRHPREKYFIATKMSNQADDPHIRSLKGSIEIYNKSMKDLQVDYFDYYLLHSVGGGNDAMATLKNRFYDNGVLDFLLKEREAGRIRNLGWSFHGDVKIFDYLLATDIKWDFVQIQLNYVDWKHAAGFNVNAEYLYEELEKRNIHAVIMEPLLGGRLATLNYPAQSILKHERAEDSAATWAFRYAGSPENVLTVLSGMVYMEHLQENIVTYSPLQPVTEHEKTILENVAQVILKYPLIQCNDCNYCMPCPYGIDIPAIFKHYNKCVNEGEVPQNKQDENYRRARRAFLVGYDCNVPKLRQANHCTSCGICVPECPQRIQIPKEMERIDKFVEELKQEKEF
jgi:predicted aldo/keto reductase-like oxidoreductase